MNPIRFAIVGTGWRTEYFLRIAQAVPDKLEPVLVVGRKQSSIERIAERWGVPVSLSTADIAGSSPEFVAASVPWPVTPVLTTELVGAGFHVFAETPPAPDLDGLRKLWAEVGDRRELVQVGEQYHQEPAHAARLAVAHSGSIGTVNSVEMASTHLYHVAALMRNYLGLGLAEATVNARAFTAPIIDPLRHAGWVDDPVEEQRTTTIATIDFGGGRYGLYNFVENQWFNPILHPRIAVRGSLGEIMDNHVLRWDGEQAVGIPLEVNRTASGELVDITYAGESVFTNPWPGTGLADDEIAVVTHLVNEGRYTRGEIGEIYPLAAGIHDHAIGLAIEESARTGHDVRVANEPWMEHK
jgi:predicted dehydrogenase